MNSIRSSRIRSSSRSYSYLLRDPLGISTITSTSMRRLSPGDRDLDAAPVPRQAEARRRRLVPGEVVGQAPGVVLVPRFGRRLVLDFLGQQHEQVDEFAADRRAVQELRQLASGGSASPRTRRPSRGPRRR